MNGNTVLDAGKAGMTFCVANPGPPSPVLRGTLSSGGGVANPSGSQVDGSLIGPAAAPAACIHLPRLRRVQRNGGGQLRWVTPDGASTPVTYDYVLADRPTAFDHGFDNVTAPTLPSGWTRTAVGTSGWAIVEGGAHGGRNRAFAPGPVASRRPRSRRMRWPSRTAPMS
ncbi:MAG: hypothetical protein R2712_08660 [Vicinamibacterales bacterium]